MTKLQALYQSVILAAGCASRARPLSDKLAKPLFPVGETCGVEWAIQASLSLGLAPLVVIGDKAEQVAGYLDASHPDMETIKVENPSTNLLDSVAACENWLSSKNFLWIGGGMFFEDIGDLRRLISMHQETGAFCTLFSQTTVPYKPKLVFEKGRLVKFVVGDYETPFSSPTAFAVSREFVKYAKLYGETEVFQSAINNRRKFEIINLRGWSEEIHTINDYYSVSKRMYPNGYHSANSKLLNTKLNQSFVYDSIIESCEVESSIIINAALSNRALRNRLIYSNTIDLPIVNVG